MKIELDSETIRTTIQDRLGAAVDRALSGYDVTKTVADVLCREVAQGAVAEALREALSKMDKSAMVQALAQELQKSTLRAATMLLHSGLLATVLKLRGIESYQPDYKENVARVLAEIEGRLDR